MKTEFRFKDLFVLDLANNHSGDFQHALRIIRAVAFPFQFRRPRSGSET